MVQVEFLDEGNGLNQIKPRTFRQASISWMAKVLMKWGIVKDEDRGKKVLLGGAIIILLASLVIFFFLARGPKTTGLASPRLIREMQLHIPRLPLPNNFQ